MSFYDDVYAFLLTVPRGKVVTYGSLAAAIGRPGAARAVGNALHSNPCPEIYPCYRVVNSKGEPSAVFAFGGANEQLRLLKDDGVEINNGRVDLKKYHI